MILRHPFFQRLLRLTAIAAFVAASSTLVLRADGLRIDNLRTGLAAAMAEAGTGLGLVVRRIDVSGRVNLPEDELGAVLEPVVGRPAFGLDLKGLRERLTANPWVGQARIRRRLPDGLEVVLTERRPFALWQHERTLSLVDRTGTVLTREDLARWRDLPFLVGSGAPQAAEELLDLVSTTPDLAQEIEAIIRIGERRWDLRMRDGLLVRLPDPYMNPAWGPEQAWARFARLARAYRLQERDISVVDLRLDDRIAVRLTPGGRPLFSGEEQRT